MSRLSQHFPIVSNASTKKLQTNPFHPDNKHCDISLGSCNNVLPIKRFLNYTWHGRMATFSEISNSSRIIFDFCKRLYRSDIMHFTYLQRQQTG